MQRFGQPIAPEAFHRTVLSGCQFVALMMDAHAAKQCSVPPGAGSMIDTVLGGFTNLSFITDFFAADWRVQAQRSA